ncbi:MAG: metallophosphoesterase, partial [Amphiplicatus sp.]
VIVGLNSARRAGLSPDWSRGRLSLKQIDFAAAGMRAAPRAARKIIALHHPILPGPGRAGVNIVARARTALAAFAAAKTDLILTGHVHVAEAGVYSAEGASMIIARAGTATSTRLRGEAPSYNLICGDNTNITITISRFAGTGYTVAARRRFVKEHGCWRETPPALDEA